MANAFDSPDTVQLKGQPTGITRLSRKAKLGMTMIAVVVVGFILFSIMSMGDEQAAPARGPSSAPQKGEKAPTVHAAKPNFDHVGDGQAAVAAGIAAAAESGSASAAAAAALAPGGQSGQNMGPAYSVGAAGEVPRLGPAALGGAAGAAGSPAAGAPAAGSPAGRPGSLADMLMSRAGTAGEALQRQSAQPGRDRGDESGRKDAAVHSSLDIQSTSDLSSLGGLSGLGNLGGLGGLGAGAGTAAAGLGANPVAAIAAQANAMLSSLGQAPQNQGLPAFGPLGGGLAQQDDPNKQGRKEQFLKSNEASAKTTLRSNVQPPMSAYEIKSGWAIPAALQCGINSDLPGQTCARVTENVFDSATGRHLLIPQNSRLIGTYDSQIAYGQERILVVWNRLIFPDGASVSLDGMPGSDQAGNAGFDAEVNNHYGKVFGSAAFMATFSAAVSLTQKQNTSVNGALTNSQTITQSLGQQLGQTGSAFIQRGMNVQPTLTRKPGYRFNVMVTRDILFPGPYRG